VLLAANPMNLELLGATLALVGLILLGAVAVFWAGRWRKPTPPLLPRPEEELSRYRTLYDQGVLSKDEFERIRLRLEKKASKAPPVPTAPAAPTAPAEGPASAPAQDAPP
jgi:hypothetical protein